MTNPRILIASPIDGYPESASVALAYHGAVSAALRCGLDVLPHVVAFSDDLGRARSRLVWEALRRDTWDWLLWWDSDVAPDDISIIGRMVSLAEHEGHDWIGAPYPAKRILARYPYRPLPDQVKRGRLDIKNDCIEVEAVAIGFTLCRRSCLERMVDHYRDTEWWTDTHELGGETLTHETVAIFRPLFTETRNVNGQQFRELLSEDYSACYRWRAMGGKVQMYVGQGAPLKHVGSLVFQGTPAEIPRFR